MWKLSLAVAALVMVSSASLAADMGRVVKVLRPSVNTFDAKGQPQGPLKATDLKVPAPIVGRGVGGSFGVKQGGKIVYLRGLDVQTDGVNTPCKPVQTAARGSGTAYAASNMGLGSASDCSKR
jgi:hypothetical protein